MKPEKQFQAAKQNFTLAALAVLRGDAEAVAMAAEALAELEAAMTALRAAPENITENTK